MKHQKFLIIGLLLFSGATMLLHRLHLRPPPLLSFSLFQKSLSIPLQTTSLFTTTNSFSSTRFLSNPSSSSFCTRFSSEAVLELPKDVRIEYDDENGSEDGDIGAEREESDSGVLEKVLETNKELKNKLPNLSVKEKKELASYAHSLGKKLKSQQVGKSGVTDTVVMALIETLEANELLKVHQKQKNILLLDYFCCYSHSFEFGFMKPIERNYCLKHLKTTFRGINNCLGQSFCYLKETRKLS